MQMRAPRVFDLRCVRCAFGLGESWSPRCVVSLSPLLRLIAFVAPGLPALIGLWSGGGLEVQGRPDTAFTVTSRAGARSPERSMSLLIGCVPSAGAPRPRGT